MEEWENSHSLREQFATQDAGEGVCLRVIKTPCFVQSMV
jgi:hypothetical protein